MRALVVCAVFWVLLLVVARPVAAADLPADSSSNSIPGFADQMARDLTAPWLFFAPYAGVGLFEAHHTGYIPGTTSAVEQWELGYRIFAGAHFSEVFAGELGYHDLGESPVPSVASTEQSTAISATILAHHRFSRYPIWNQLTNGALDLPALNQLSLFAKAGGAYKWIDQRLPGGAVVKEDGLTYVVGIGAETGLPHGTFARFELDYIGKIGTSVAIDVQHTSLGGSIGLRF